MNWVTRLAGLSEAFRRKELNNTVKHIQNSLSPGNREVAIKRSLMHQDSPYIAQLERAVKNIFNTEDGKFLYQHLCNVRSAPVADKDSTMFEVGEREGQNRLIDYLFYINQRRRK